MREQRTVKRSAGTVVAHAPHPHDIDLGFRDPPRQMNRRMNAPAFQLPVVEEAQGGREVRRQGGGLVHPRREGRGGARLVVVLQEAGAAALGIGGELVHPDHLKSGNAELIVENARRVLAIVAKTRAKMGSTGVLAGRSA